MVGNHHHAGPKIQTIAHQMPVLKQILSAPSKSSFLAISLMTKQGQQHARQHKKPSEPPEQPSLRGGHSAVVEAPGFSPNASSRAFFIIVRPFMVAIKPEKNGPVPEKKPRPAAFPSQVETGPVHRSNGLSQSRPVTTPARHMDKNESVQPQKMYVCALAIFTMASSNLSPETADCVSAYLILPIAQDIGPPQAKKSPVDDPMPTPIADPISPSYVT
mmetsp:Transcript_87971/g.155981  ORF Transcript_87971/g.155981 Transcript_87971/m.155981 type:complete len:217 (-) Transcript_87971:129-779(-)